MTDDVRDRILGLLHAGPATVQRLAAVLGLPGGVVSYQLKRLEQDGLVRVGFFRTLRGVPTPVYVSTAAAVPPPLPRPVPLPGLTWTGTGDFPLPVWTVPPPPAGSPVTPASSAAAEPGWVPPQGAGPPALAEPVLIASAPTEPVGAKTEPVPPAAARGVGTTQPAPARGVGTTRPAPARVPEMRGPGPQPDRPAWPAAPPGRGPRMIDVRRIPADDATFYEFAARLDALVREFAARATPGAPAAELSVGLHRPDGDPAGGYGS